MKKSICKKMLTMALACILVLSSITSAFACTGVYVGGGVTENGSTYMGRSEDIGDRYGKVFGMADPQTITADTVFKDTYGFSMKYSDLEFDYPSTTYSYTYVRDSYQYGETMQDANGNYVGEAYAEAGQNEKGVAMTATVSTRYNNSAKAADKLVGTGICEVSMTSILLGGAATAKEAVDLLAEIIDKYGAGECNSIMISDAKETWYFEIVSGHQYAAVKMPADKVSVQPNIMLLGVIDVNDTENVVASANLVSLAQENGFLVTDENGKIDVTATYGNPTGASKRYWQGMFYFNEEAANVYVSTDADGNVTISDMDYDLLFDTTKKLSTLDVLHLLAYRGEGSAWDYSAKPNLGNSNVIGTRSQSECHIFETRPNMPKELAVLQWQCMADAEFGIYVPYYSALLVDTSELYDTEVIPKSVDLLTGDTEDQINTNFHLINHLCDMNRETDPEVGAAVKAYFEKYQQSLIDQQAVVDAAMKEIYAADVDVAKALATALHKHLAKQISDMSSAVLAEIRAYFSEETHTAPFALSEAVTAVMPVYAEVEHDEGQQDFDEDGHWTTCTICGWVLDIAEHEIETKYDENGHWDVCTGCEYTTEPVAHEMGIEYDENGHWDGCKACDYALEAAAHETEILFDENGHWDACTACDYATEAAAHETETLFDENGHWDVCAGCEYVSEAAAHELATVFDKDGHWTECGDCDYATEAVAHEFVNSECACGQVKAPQTGDNFNTVLYVGLLTLSALAAAAVVLYTKKQKA